MRTNYAPCFDELPVDKLMKTLSEILSDKYDAKITITARKKEEVL